MEKNVPDLTWPPVSREGFNSQSRAQGAEKRLQGHRTSSASP